MIYTWWNVGCMTCGMLVAVHRTSDISFSNNHSTYVHLSTLSPSLITLISLCLVKDASKSRTVELFKNVYAHTHTHIYKILSKISSFILFFLRHFNFFKRFIYFLIQILHQLSWYLWKDALWKRRVEQNEKEATDSGTTSAHYFIKGWEEIAVYRWPVEEKTRIYIYMYVYKGDRERRGRF